MKNSNTFAISILLLCSILLACNFKFGETASDNPNKEIEQNNNSDEKTESKKSKRKLMTFRLNPTRLCRGDSAVTSIDI